MWEVLPLPQLLLLIQESRILRSDRRRQRREQRLCKNMYSYFASERFSCLDVFFFSLMRTSQDHVLQNTPAESGDFQLRNHRGT